MHQSIGQFYRIVGIFIGEIAFLLASANALAGDPKIFADVLNQALHARTFLTLAGIKPVSLEYTPGTPAEGYRWERALDSAQKEGVITNKDIIFWRVQATDKTDWAMPFALHVFSKKGLSRILRNTEVIEI